MNGGAAGRVPDFLIGGAVKGGTTSLFRWLGEHPRITMPAVKELRFFDQRYELGLDWYREQLAFGTEGLVGEASPRYLHVPVAAERIARDLPRIRMVFSLREPGARAYSHYWMRRNLGTESEPFERVLDDARLRERYLVPGHYAEHLVRYERLLGRDRLCVVTSDDLAARPRDTFRAVCRFLGVDDATVPASVGSRVNSGVTFRSRSLRRVTKRWPKPVRDAIGRVNARPWSPPPMAEEVRARLDAHFAEANRALTAHLGRELGWDRSRASGAPPPPAADDDRGDR